MADTQTTADRLYGAPQAASADAAPPTVDDRSHEARAERMYAPPPAPEARTDVPPAIAELRAADRARQMFNPAKAFEAELPDGALPGIDVVEARECAADLGAEVADLRELRTLANAQEEPDIDAWRTASHQMIAERGYQPAELDAARQLVQRDPRVAAYLDATGLGSHPKVVEKVILLARKARINGTLKRN